LFFLPETHNRWLLCYNTWRLKPGCRNMGSPAN
jgi:hypothetical protein